MRKRKLGDICVFNYGNSLPENFRNSGEVCVYGSNGIVGKHDKALTKGPTIVVGRKGSIGEIHVSSIGCWPIDTTYYIDTDSTECAIEWLGYLLQYLQLASFNKASGVPGLNREDAYAIEVVVPDTRQEQQLIADEITGQFTKLSEVSIAIDKQMDEVARYCDALIFDSLNSETVVSYTLADVLDEVKIGVGQSWKDYPVLGATRAGLALAKEPPGKTPQRYKPVVPGTVFYNPMRILIGSIAFVDDDDEPGITSPDYVVLKGKPSVVDSRWFYYWMRSPLGEQTINSLARGAVRERMLFNRLAEGEIEVPAYEVQVKASQALAAIRPMREAIAKQKQELERMPQKLLAQVFEN